MAGAGASVGIRHKVGGDHLDCQQDGCSAEILRKWVRRTERDTGQRPGVTTDEQQRMKALEREVRAHLS